MAAHLPHPLTIDSLFDECLVPVLARVPLTDQLTSLPLTCTRWNSLLSRVHKERSQLVIWNSEQSPSWECKDLSLFNNLTPTLPLPCLEYLTNLLRDVKPSETASQATPKLNPDFLFRSKQLDESLIYQHLFKTFPNLRHLSLVGLKLSTDNLLIPLLSHYRRQLTSLFLDHTFTWNDAEPAESRRFSVRSLISVINSMSSLRRLALSINPGESPTWLAGALSTVLGQLTEFGLAFNPNLGYPLLLALDERKVTRLSLLNTVWPEGKLFGDLLEERPGFASLTHLTLGTLVIPGSSSRSNLQVIADSFPELQYLDFATFTPLLELFPMLSQLSRLVHLQVTLSNSWTSSALHIGTPWSIYWSHRELNQLRSTNAQPHSSLRTLSLYGQYLEIEYLSLLPSFLPNVDRLFLDQCHFYCHFERKYIRLPSERPIACTCKSRLKKALDSFEKVPKIPERPPKGRFRRLLERTSHASISQVARNSWLIFSVSVCFFVTCSTHRFGFVNACLLTLFFAFINPFTYCLLGLCAFKLKH